MLVTLVSEKMEKVLEFFKSFFKRDGFTIRALSGLVGTLASTIIINLNPCSTDNLRSEKNKI